jgi:hypothetical protein
MKEKIYTEDESLLLMEVAGLLGHYFLHFIYIQGNSMNKCSSIINTWTEEFFHKYGNMENINLLGWEPYNYGFSGKCWRFQDVVKEFGENKIGFKIDISKREYEKIDGLVTWLDTFKSKIEETKEKEK